MDNKIELKDIKKIIGDDAYAPIEMPINNGDKDIVVLVKPSLTFKERAAAVDDMSYIIYSVGIFDYSRVLFARGWAILSYYTNIEVPADAELVWSVINRSNVADRVEELVDDDIDEMLECAIKMARMRKEEDVARPRNDLDMALKLLVESASDTIEDLRNTGLFDKLAEGGASVSAENKVNEVPALEGDSPKSTKKRARKATPEK